MTRPLPSCELCATSGAEILWQDELCRVIRVAEPGHPAFCRVIWNEHVAEMTDLAAAERRHLMRLVFATEAALRRLYRPEKINLASLGNVVPHLHWHVIARFAGDRHFPRPIWAEALRTGDPVIPPVTTEALRQAIILALAEEEGSGA
ncbi:MAG: HIT family protein [Rhodocyclaceae bacterium]|nr:HIT family protein [Rhodocyclaceae bacterium]